MSAENALRQCRAPGCETMHARALFCCRHHWYRLPKQLRDDVWRAYRQHGVISVEYLQAAENAEAYLEDRDARDMSEALAS